MSKATTSARAAAGAAAVALLLAACGGSDGGSSGSSTQEGTKGGAIHYLSQGAQIQHLDPQRNYTGEDIAFVGGTMQRTLVQYVPSAVDAEANKLEPDLATDTGRSSDENKTWAFTLKDGVKFEDGSAITCEDVKYGVSRTFATDIITDGPTYAILYLDIPSAKDGSSAYKGPYKKTGQALFDKAVTCSEDNKTITFKLKISVPDFNFTTTLLAFSPVPEKADTGERYDAKPVASGPYKIEEYKVGKTLKLVRNDQWDPATDTIRKAYPDTQDVTFGLTSSVITQRLMSDSGEDQFAVPYGGNIDPASLAAVFNSPQYENRRFDGYDPYVRYYAINTEKVTELNHRLAMQAAMPRATIRTINGGNFAGDLADGVIKPTLSTAYKPSEMYSNLAGKYAIPDDGDPEVAKTLIAESGKPMPTITIDYPKTETNDKVVGAIVSAFQKAGIKTKPNPIDPGAYYGIVLDPKKAGAFMSSGWAPDWLNASTVIPPLFTINGGFDLSRWDNAAFQKEVDATSVMSDLTKQGEAWAALNKQAMESGLAVPTLFTKMQRLVGSKVGGAFFWAPYGSWGYPNLSAMQ